MTAAWHPQPSDADDAWDDALAVAALLRRHDIPVTVVYADGERAVPGFPEVRTSYAGQTQTVLYVDPTDRRWQLGATVEVFGSAPHPGDFVEWFTLGHTHPRDLVRRITRLHTELVEHAALLATR